MRQLASPTRVKDLGCLTLHKIPRLMRVVFSSGQRSHPPIFQLVKSSFCGGSASHASSFKMSTFDGPPHMSNSLIPNYSVELMLMCTSFI